MRYKPKRREEGSYSKRKGKTYRHALPNTYNSPKTRRENYNRLRMQGASVEQARRGRDMFFG